MRELRAGSKPANPTCFVVVVFHKLSVIRYWTVSSDNCWLFVLYQDYVSFFFLSFFCFYLSFFLFFFSLFLSSWQSCCCCSRNCRFSGIKRWQSNSCGPCVVYHCSAFIDFYVLNGSIFNFFSLLLFLSDLLLSLHHLYFVFRYWTWLWITELAGPCFSFTERVDRTSGCKNFEPQ